MTHDYHEGDHIWYDDCHECSLRAANLPSSICSLDEESFVRAWKDAATYNRDGIDRDLSMPEKVLFGYLWYMQIMLDRFGKFPIGVMPSLPVTVIATLEAFGIGIVSPKVAEEVIGALKG